MSSLLRSTVFSIEVAAASTALAALIGTPLAMLMARKKFIGKSVVEAILTLPLVLPPTVVGFGLIVLVGRHGWIGHWLATITNGYSMLFRPEGAVLAGTVVALPLYYLPARSAFAGIDHDLQDVARLMGASTMMTFWHVTLPLARRGIVAGLTLAMARAMGEFGATVMVLGDLPQHTTLPIAVYDAWLSGDMQAAGLAAAVLAGLSLAMMFTFNRSPMGRVG